MKLNKFLPLLIKSEIETLYDKCGFTEEEIEICELFRRRRSNEEVARKMSMSMRTLDRRISDIKRKIEKVGII